MTWQTMDTAPRDGTWIVAFRKCVNPNENPYIVIRWWDGIVPEYEDDFSTDETPQWVGVDSLRLLEDVTHWIAFEEHPDAPGITTGMNNGEAPAPSRRERGLSDEDIIMSRLRRECFEEYFERHGHCPHDEVLQQMAELRFGLEFAASLPTTTGKEAIA